MTAVTTERPTGRGPVAVEITPRKCEPTTIEFVTDLETVVESEKCSCNAGDDNPY